MNVASSRSQLLKPGGHRGSRASISRHENKSNQSFEKSVNRRLDKLTALGGDGQITASDLEVIISTDH